MFDAINLGQNKPSFSNARDGNRHKDIDTDILITHFFGPGGHRSRYFHKNSKIYIVQSIHFLYTFLYSRRKTIKGKWNPQVFPDLGQSHSAHHINDIK